MADLIKKNRASNTRVVGADPTTGAETNWLAVTENNDAQVVDRASESGESATITVTNVAKIANVAGNGLSAENKDGRVQIEIQPLDGVIFVGYSAASQPHRISRRNFYIAKIGPNVDIYIRKSGAAAADVAISELA